MAMIDDQLTFSSEQAVTADAASTNYLDLGVAYKPGPGERVSVRIHITETFATNTSLDFKLQTDDNTSFSSASDIATLNKTVSAALNAGDVYEIVFPIDTAERYVRMYYDVNGTNATAGKVTAYLDLANAGQHNLTD